jgi:hypothetical protein
LISRRKLLAEITAVAPGPGSDTLNVGGASKILNGLFLQSLFAAQVALAPCKAGAFSLVPAASMHPFQTCQRDTVAACHSRCFR